MDAAGDGTVVVPEGVLGELTARFGAAHPECGDRWAVHDRCESYAAAFTASLVAAGLAAETVAGVRYGEMFGLPVVLGGHFATTCDGLVVDWTARQFDPGAPVPAVVPLAVWRREWQEIGSEPVVGPG